MLSFNLLAGVCVAYVCLLFLVAFLAERRARLGRSGWLKSPVVYTLSLSIYCTGWTFYGAVGYAAQSGLEYATIYLGPTIVLAGWWLILRKLVRIGRSQRVTSIADLISSRYGKSTFLGVLVTLLAVAGTTPYIALQLQSVTLAFGAFYPVRPEAVSSGLLVAVGLALFTIIFGTRNLDVNERHHGVVIAIAVEAVVKLVALVGVGVFAVWGIGGGLGEVMAAIDASRLASWEVNPARWVTMTMVSAAAFLCLPRMFHVIVVENSDETHLVTASWAVPIYLLLISLFVIPIAVVGLNTLPEGSNPDLFVLTLPLAFGEEKLAVLSFLGGFSAATSMVIVASIALSTMVSNHIILPIWLAVTAEGQRLSGDVRMAVLTARRLSIMGVLGLGYLYYRYSGGGAALASMGLIAFLGVAQILPAMLGGIFWRGATRAGAGLGISLGFAIWAYTLFLPSVGTEFLMSESVVDDGPFGIALLRPQALFGIDGLDPLVHAAFWSLGLNTILFFLGSLMSFPAPLERLQGATFVNVFRYSGAAGGYGQSFIDPEDLLVMAQRILGPVEAQALFVSAASAQGKRGYLPDVTPQFLQSLERELSGSVGAATAHAMMGQISGGLTVSVEDLMRVADETAQMMEEQSQLQAKSLELERTAGQLREANEKLTQLSIQKDGFLGQISHELRTPMTSIRSFSEILMGDASMTSEERRRYSAIIHDECLRLTRLLDDLLDLSVLENGQVSLHPERTSLGTVLDRAVQAALGRAGDGGLAVTRRFGEEAVPIQTDPERLAQVFINVIANAQKYCDARSPELTITVRNRLGKVSIDFVDNGSGIPKASQTLIFEKFARLSDHRAAGGAGLGLAICREIMHRLGGTIEYLPGQGGAAFRVTLPLVMSARAA